MNAARWGLWLAVSSDQQAERYSLTEQAQLGHQHAAKWGGEVVAELRVAESRSIVLLEDAAARIPAYAELRRLIADRAIDVLCCYDTSRLGRKTSLIMSVVELCAEAGIIVYEIENPPTSLDDTRGYDRRILDAIKATGYQHEVDKLKARLTYGRIGRIKAGRFPGRTPPYGYAYAYDAAGRRTIVTVPEAADVIRRIFAEYLAGSGCNNIADRLTADGIPSPAGGVWNKSGVYVIVKRAATYAGWAQGKVKGHGVIRARALWEAIIDDAIADAVAGERATRRNNRRTANSKARLTGVVWCEVCRKPMRQVVNETGIVIAYDKRPGRRPVQRRALFYCVGKHPGGSVGTNRVLAALRAAIDVLAGQDLTALADVDSNRTDELLAQIARCEAAIERHETALGRADDAYVAGLMDADRYAAVVGRINGQITIERAAIDKLIATIAAEQARGTRADRLATIVANGYALLDTPDTAQANAWLRQRVRVWVSDNMVTEVEWL